MRTLTLLVGNVLTPRVAEYGTRGRAIETFLSRCDVLAHHDTSTAGWICAAFGVQQQADWPAGAILAQAHQESDTGMYWICADPVHLEVDRDSLLLRSHLQLSESESLALFGALKAHFDDVDLCLEHIDPGHWCIGTRHHPRLVTSDLELVEGRDVNDLLPSGPDSTAWQRYMTEAQMIMHDHPVNVSRESRGDAAANSLWLWGGGITPDIGPLFDNMIIDDPLLRETAKLSGADAGQSAGRFADLTNTGNIFVEFPGQSTSGDEKTISRLESDWMVPAWQALRSGHLDKLTLVIRLSGAVIECSCDRRSRHRFWRRRHPLTHTLSQLKETL